jgi:hypothetical protein
LLNYYSLLLTYVVKLSSDQVGGRVLKRSVDSYKVAKICSTPSVNNSCSNTKHHSPHPSPLLPVHLPLHGAPAWEAALACRRLRRRDIDSAWMSIVGCAGSGALCGGLGQAAERIGQPVCGAQGMAGEVS